MVIARVAIYFLRGSNQYALDVAILLERFLTAKLKPLALSIVKGLLVPWSVWISYIVL